MKKVILPSILFLTSLLCVSLVVTQSDSLALAGADTDDLKTITFGKDHNPFPHGNGSGYCYSDDNTGVAEQTYSEDKAALTGGGDTFGLSNNLTDGSIATYNWKIFVHGVTRIDFSYQEEGEAGSLGIYAAKLGGDRIDYNRTEDKTGVSGEIINGYITYDSPSDVYYIAIWPSALAYCGVNIFSLKITYSESACREQL